MLGMFDLLPLMKGWDYKPKTWTRELSRGQVLEVERAEESGWLLSLYVITNDCYGGFEVLFQGADLGLFSTGVINPKILYDYGALMQDPSGWLQLYYRPNPQSSVGVFLLVQNSQGFQGSTLPHVPTTIVKLRLESQSTQEKATVSLTAFRVIITNKKQFIKSLRAVMGMPTIQDIDPALLVAGLQDVTQRGKFDEEKKEKQ